MSKYLGWVNVEWYDGAPLHTDEILIALRFIDQDGNESFQICSSWYSPVAGSFGIPPGWKQSDVAGWADFPGFVES